MLSDSPPERDVIWTEEGVQGAHRFVQRVWRLVGELAEARPRRTERTRRPRDPRHAVRKAAHRALAAVEEDIERLRFNRCVAHIYEFANALQELLGACQGRSKSRASSAAFAEAGRIFVQILAPMMPHLAEECWQALGAAGARRRERLARS